MPTPALLHLDAGPSSDQSLSRAITSEFVACWKAVHADGLVLRRDLHDSPIPAITSDWLVANATPPQRRSATQCETLARSDSLIAELRDTQEWVIGVPMHHLTPPIAFETWIDHVVRIRESHADRDGTDVEPFSTKTVHVFATSDNFYELGTGASRIDFVTPYFRTIFLYLGLSQIDVVCVPGTAAISLGLASKEDFLKPLFLDLRKRFRAIG